MTTKTRNVHTFSSAAYLTQLMAELDRAGICRRIAEARERAGLTQPELGDALAEPAHWRSVQLWERGEKSKKGVHRWTVPWDRLDDIARITQVTKDWLLHGEQAEAPAHRGELEGRVDSGFEAVTAILERMEERQAQIVERLAALEERLTEPPKRRAK